MQRIPHLNKRITRQLLLMALLGAFVINPAIATFLAPLKLLAETARSHGPSHLPWQTLLTQYLDTTAADGVNRFRYSAVTPADMGALTAYLDSL